MDCFYPIIAGEYAGCGVVSEIRSPFSGETIAVVGIATREAAETAAGKTQEAFAITRKLPAYRRAEILGGIARKLEESQNELARIIASEAGKPIRDAKREVGRAIFTFQYAAEETKRFGGEIMPLDQTSAFDGYKSICVRAPRGPCLFITPFNFPLNLAAHKIAPAIAVGCPFLLKPAPQTPVSALKLGEIILQAGWPKEAVSVVPCENVVAEWLVTSPYFRVMSFTGSAKVGWKLKTVAGKKHVLLELGGNAAVIVDDDADLGMAAARCSYGAFTYAGQTCISVQRIYIHEKAYAGFLDLFLTLVKRLKTGDPLEESSDIGPVISDGAAERLEIWLEEAKKRGAKVLCGGKRNGRLFEPTVLEGVRHDCKVYCEEVFGPVTLVQKVGSFAEGLSLAETSPYGLQAGIFTSKITAAFKAFDSLNVGSLMVNEVPTFRSDVLPYGGTKDSGIGREGVRSAMEELTEPKVLVIKT